MQTIRGVGGVGPWQGMPDGHPYESLATGTPVVFQQGLRLPNMGLRQSFVYKEVVWKLRI